MNTHGKFWDEFKSKVNLILEFPKIPITESLFDHLKEAVQDFKSEKMTGLSMNI